MHLIDFTLMPVGSPDVWASVPIGDFGLGMEYEERVVQIACFHCSGYNIETAPLRRVVGASTTPDSLFPSRTYRLACGHSVI